MSVTHIPPKNNPSGMSGSWWRSQHNRHHAAPQKVGRDVDLDTLPLVAFAIATIKSTKYGKWLVEGSDEEKKTGKVSGRRDFARTFLKSQKQLFTPIICPLVAFFWQLYLHPRHSLRTGNYIELFWIGLRYLTCYMFLCAEPTSTFGFAWSLGLPPKRIPTDRKSNK